MRLRCETSALRLVLLLAAPAWGGSVALPVGGEFLVNTYTTHSQKTPSVSMDANGAFVVVWESIGSNGSDTSHYSVQARRFSASGTPLGGQFQVNTLTTDIQSNPSVARAAGGEFVVTWTSDVSIGNDSSGRSIQGQRYAASGAMQGGQFQINSYILENQHDASLSMSPDGEFVVVWESLGSSGGDSSSHSIQMQRYAPGGTAQGTQTQINDYTTSSQQRPSVSQDVNGEFVVVWDSNGSNGGDSSEYSVQGQRYTADGTAQGEQFQVNVSTLGIQAGAAVSRGRNGDFVAVWTSEESSGNDSSGFSIQGRLYSADGTPQGGEFQVNTYTTGTQQANAVAKDVDGDFVVIWQSNGSNDTDSSGFSVQGRRYAASGAPLGEQFQVNTYTPNTQSAASVAIDGNGNFLVAFQSSFAIPSFPDIRAQRFRVTGNVLGRVFFDQNLDGLQNEGEPGLEGVVVELYDEELVLRRTAVTTAAGTYRLEPKEGGWHLKFVLPANYAFTAQDVGFDDDIDSDADPDSGETDPFQVEINMSYPHVDAGVYSLLLFADGFESGSTSSWSATEP